jgi:hypothetical protein
LREFLGGLPVLHFHGASSQQQGRHERTTIQQAAASRRHALEGPLQRKHQKLCHGHHLSLSRGRESSVLRSPFCVYCERLWQAAFILALRKISASLCLHMRNREPGRR